MSLIPCPECGTDISNKARFCPYCGFQSDNPSRPISEQDEYIERPHFQFVFDYYDEQLCELPHEDAKTIFDCFSDWKFLCEKIPSIANFIVKILHKEKRLEADLSCLNNTIDYKGVQKKVIDLIEQGIYKFQKSKDGQLRAVIVNEYGEFKVHVPLKEVNVPPDVLGAINHLQAQAQMAEILHEIKAVSEQLQELRLEIKNDRLAKIDTAFESLSNANHIRSKRLRDLTITNVMNHCLDAKHALMRNLKAYIDNINSNYNKKIFPKNCEQQANDAFEALQFITRAVQLECMAYSMLGQYDICKKCLREFNAFIIQNNLNNRDTLLIINENLKNNRIEFVDQIEKTFVNISLQISNFNTSEYFTKHREAIPLPDISME